VLYYCCVSLKVKAFDAFQTAQEEGGSMELVHGFLYCLRGLRVGVTTGRLLFWGLVRFVLVIVVMAALTGLILAYHTTMMELLWSKPQSAWIAWLWHVVSWLLSLFLIALSALLSYLISQVLFSVVIMDHMSRLTELKATGRAREAPGGSLWRSLVHLIGQEIPRAIVPVLLSILVMILGWITPFGPLVALVSSAVSILFLSWDNTDLIPARLMLPFRTRFRFLLKTLPFHLGFGLPFLVPGLNILFLAFAPVGATLYYIEKHASGERETPSQGATDRGPA
jgi:CysZ protein